MVLVLGPGDQPPHPDELLDYMDYRGVAEEIDLKALHSGVVDLGKQLHPSGKKGRALFLPSNLLTEHCAIFGSTGRGKTAGIIIPWIKALLRQGYSVVTIDIVGNLLDELRNEAHKLGRRFWYWDTVNYCSDSWNWLSEINPDSRADLDRSIYSLLGKPFPGQDPFFRERDERYLRTLIRIAQTIYSYKVKPRDLYRIVADPNLLLNLFRQYPKIQQYAVDIPDLLSSNLGDRNKTISSLFNKLSIFNDSQISQITESNSFLISDIDSQSTLLLIKSDFNNSGSEQLTGLMLSQLFSHVNQRFNAKTNSINSSVPLYFAIDESPRLKDKINYADLLAVARNAKVGICLAAQDISNFDTEQNSILTNCNTIISLKGNSPEIAEWLSRKMGQRKQKQTRLSQKRSWIDDWKDMDRGESLLNILFHNMSIHPVSVDIVDVPVLGNREIMHLPMGKYPAVVWNSKISSKPFLVDLDLSGRT